MQTTKSELVLRKDDYAIIISYLKSAPKKTALDQKNAEELEAELKKARLVEKEEFPSDVIRLNSKVKIKEHPTGKVMELTLVTPGRADIKKRMISVLAPMGTALLGFREGREVKWEVPSGKKTFTIVEVSNESEETDVRPGSRLQAQV